MLKQSRKKTSIFGALSIKGEEERARNLDYLLFFPFNRKTIQSSPQLLHISTFVF